MYAHAYAWMHTDYNVNEKYSQQIYAHNSMRLHNFMFL